MYDRLELGLCGPMEGPVHNVTGAIIDSVAATSYPTGVDRHAPGWHVLGRISEFALYVQRVRLAPRLRGVLVHAHGGIWCRKRHFLIVASGTRLMLAWTSPEQDVFRNGSRLSRYVRGTVEDHGEFEAIHYFRGLLERLIVRWDGDVLSGEPAEVEAAVYRWNAETGKIEQHSIAEAGVPIYAVVYATGRSAHDAFIASLLEWNCIWAEFFVATDSFPNLEPGGVVFADFNWRKAVALRRLEAHKKACDTELSRKAYIAKLSAFPEPFHRFSPTRPPQ